MKRKNSLGEVGKVARGSQRASARSFTHSGLMPQRLRTYRKAQSCHENWRGRSVCIKIRVCTDMTWRVVLVLFLSVFWQNVSLVCVPGKPGDWKGKIKRMTDQQDLSSLVQQLRDFWLGNKANPGKSAALRSQVSAGGQRSGFFCDLS